MPSDGRDDESYAEDNTRNPAAGVGSAENYEENWDDGQFGEIFLEDGYIIHDRENHQAYIQADEDACVDLSDWR